MLKIFCHLLETFWKKSCSVCRCHLLTAFEAVAETEKGKYSFGAPAPACDSTRSAHCDVSLSAGVCVRELRLRFCHLCTSCIGRLPICKFHHFWVDLSKTPYLKAHATLRRQTMLGSWLRCLPESKLISHDEKVAFHRAHHLQSKN